MTYFGVIASAVLHVGGLFLLLSARAPDPLVPLGSDTPLDVSIISLNEYNAITSQAPQSSTLAALRVQPEAPQPPVPFDLDPLVDTQDDTAPEPEPPAPIDLAMRLTPPEADLVPEIEDEPPLPESAEVAVAPAPLAPAVDAEALQDREVDPRDLIPNDDVTVAIAPPAPKPPRGVFDAPLIDTSPDEPPLPSETEGEGETVSEEPAPPPPEPEPEPVQTAEVDDPAPLATPFPVPKPRGSLAVASEEEPAPAPAQVVEAPQPPAPAPRVETPAPTQSQLSEAEMEQERRMMAAIMEQMRANQPPTEQELRAAEAEALRKVVEEQRIAEAEAAQKRAEEQRRQQELAALNEAERRAAEEAYRREQAEAARLAQMEAERKARADAAFFAARKAEADAKARAEAEREARALAELRAQQEAALQEQRAQQEEAFRQQQAAQEAARRAAIEEQRRIREAELARQRAEAARLQAERDLANRRQQLADLNASVAPETTATNVLTGAAPTAAAPSQDSFLGGDTALASILNAAGNAANRASTGPSFSQGGGVRQGVSLTQGETDAVLNQLRRCWRVDTFSANARSQVVTLQAQIRQNGFINQATIRVMSPVPTPPEYRIAVERAVSALQDRRCQPFALPPAKYNAWRDIVIRFDPAQMVLQ